MLALWKKIYDQLRQHIKKQRHYFVNKGPSSQAMVFPVVMYECEMWTIKKAEHQRINAFEKWCWRTLESPMDCKEIKPVNPKGNQSWLFIEGLMLKLEFFGNLMQRANSLEKTLMMTWKGLSSQGYGFSSGHVWMLELDYKASWAPKNWCFWTVVLEETLKSPLDSKETQSVHPKGDQSWVFIGRTDAKAETPKLWPPHGKCWVIGKDPDAGRDWGQEERHHRLNAHEFGWTPGVGGGQGSLACCDSWGCKESDMTEWLNWTEGRFMLRFDRKQ